MGSNIWFISDTHFNHAKPFILEPRGFDNVQDMNEQIIENWNALIKPEDTVYHLGDVIMGDLAEGLNVIKQLNGHIHLAIGNHDTEMRLAAFKDYFDEIQFGYRLNTKHCCYLLSHYPQLTNNSDRFYTYSIHGHTHSSNAFCEYPLMYNVNCEAHNCCPVAYEDMIAAIKKYHKDIID